MGVTTFEWGTPVQHEANKCWIYSLLASILLSGVEILILNLKSTKASSSKESEEMKKETKRSKTPAAATFSTEKPPNTTNLSKIYTQLIIDCCDILLPGSAVGWSPAVLAAPLVVGVASTVSTTLAGREIWKRVQQNST